MATTRSLHDEPFHGTWHLTDDLAIVEDGVTVLAEDLAIVDAAPTVVDDRAIVVTDDLTIVPDEAVDEVRPVLVDLRGRRSRTVRVLSLGAVTATAALLASIPGSLLLSARTQGGAVQIGTGSAAVRWSAFTDVDCDGARSATEAAAAGQRVDLVRTGIGVVATTWTDANGSFGFDGLARDAHYRVRVARTDPAPAPAPGSVLEPGAAGALATSSTVVVELPWSDADGALALPAIGSACTPSP